MALDDYYRSARFAKPEPRQRGKARGKRREKAVVGTVRPQVVARDGYCRLYWRDAEHRVLLWRMFGVCHGPSEWSHFNATHRRSKTMGQEPEARHTVAGSLMLCRYHAHEYDENRMGIETLDAAAGCDGRLRVTRDGNTWEEP